MDDKSLPIQRVDVLDLRSTTPALSATSDIPVVETKPDSAPAKSDDQVKGDPAEASKEGEKPEVGDPDAKDDTTEEQSGEPPAKKKPPKGVQKALDRLNREKQEQRERAEAAEARLAKVLDRVEEVLPKPKEQQAPKREDFDDPEQYIEAKAEWIAEQETAKRLDEKQRADLDNAVKLEQNEILTKYNERRAEIVKELDDFEEVALNDEIRIPMPAVQAILMHKDGPRIQYYLGQHPEEAAKLFELNPLQAVGRIHEIGLEVKASVRQVSKAPDPIKPLGSRDSASQKDPAEMSMDEYAAYAKSRDDNARKARSRK